MKKLRRNVLGHSTKLSLIVLSVLLMSFTVISNNLIGTMGFKPLSNYYLDIVNYPSLPQNFTVYDGCATSVGTFPVNPGCTYNSQTGTTVTTAGVTQTKGAIYYIKPNGVSSAKIMKVKFKVATLNLLDHTFRYDWSTNSWTVLSTQNTDIATQVSSLPLPCRTGNQNGGIGNVSEKSITVIQTPDNTLSIFSKEDRENNQIEIFDIQGRSVYSKSHSIKAGNNINVDLSTFEKGAYSISVSNINETITQKFIVQ